MKRYIYLLMAALLACGSSCGKEETITDPEWTDDPVNPPVTQEDPEKTAVHMKVDMSVVMNSVSLKTAEVDGITEYSFTTIGSDPFFHLGTLTSSLSSDYIILAFDYKLNSDQELQIFYCSPNASEANSTKLNLPASTAWTSWSYDIELDRQKSNWGSIGHRLRLDIGVERGVSFSLRNIRVRKATAAEIEARESDPNGNPAKQKRATALKNYLSASYSNNIYSVEAGENLITVQGSAAASGQELVEIMPSADITDKQFSIRQSVSGNFKARLDRFVVRDGYKYDRLLSRWALVSKVSDKEDKLCSHARYADVIPCSSTMAEVTMKTRKGIAGYFGPSQQTSDLDELQASSITINITPNSFFYTTNPGSCYTHEYAGRTWYVSKSQVDNYDKRLLECQKRGIVVGAIILIQRTASDEAIAKAVVHPNCCGGNYTMPNMTTSAGLNTYAAMLDFLAKRYSPADGTHGSIHCWIMQNEVDAASTWTNMGTNLPEILVTNEYEKSLRMCYNIARQYYPHAKVLASFTHTWTQTDNSDGYTSKSMLTDLVKYSSQEGDFEWGVAYHPYPQNLLDPCLWKNDTKATYSMNSGFVTFKNPEVIDKWILMPENMYKGTYKRALWFSENGTSAPSYSDADLANQAAGAAWIMKKIYKLKGIDGIQWHNWWDHPTEAAQGLHLGLRDSNYNVKPVWYVYKAAGTSAESEVLDKYLSVIGITSWDSIYHEL